jgi:hypothetical protein
VSRLRAPRIAGVAGGAGTSTVAAALRGYDQGRAVDEGFEVLTCRCTGDSLHAAATVISWLAANSRPRPVLAVTCDGPVPARGPLRARLRMIEPRVAGLVVLPFVAHWRELTDPRREAAALAEYPTARLPKTLRGYGEAVAALAEALLRSGLLQPERPRAPHTSPSTLPHTSGPIAGLGRPAHPSGPSRPPGHPSQPGQFGPAGLPGQLGSSGWPNRPSACEHPSMPNQPGQFGRPFRPDLAVAPALPLGGA